MRDSTSLLRHRLVIVNGHDEYWTVAMRDGFDAAVAGGTNLAFMSSNDAYWNIRYEDDRPHDPHLQVAVRPEPGHDAEDGDVP